MTRLLWKSWKIHKRVKWQGMDVSVETPAGDVRHWHDQFTGESGCTPMLYDYGYLRKTGAHDGDHVDVYVGPMPDTAPMVYVVRQMKGPDFTAYDEDKCMIGFGSRAEAEAAYHQHYDKPGFLGWTDEYTVEAFLEAVRDTHRAPQPVGGYDTVAHILKSATTGSAAVIALGPLGGKIIGYDKQHKPIYATDSAPPAVDALPAGIQSLIDLGKASTTVSVHVAPNAQSKDIFVVDIRALHGANAVDEFLADLVSAPPKGLMVSKRTLPLASGGVRVGVRAVELPEPAPPIVQKPAIKLVGSPGTVPGVALVEVTNVLNEPFLGLEISTSTPQETVNLATAALTLGAQDLPLLSADQDGSVVSPSAMPNALPAIEELTTSQVSQIVAHMMVDSILGTSGSQLAMDGKKVVCVKRGASGHHGVDPVGLSPLYAEVVIGIATGWVKFSADDPAIKAVLAEAKLVNHLSLPVGLPVVQIADAAHAAPKLWKVKFAAWNKAAPKVPEGYSVVDHTALAPAVDPMKSDNGWMGASVPFGVVTGRLKHDPSKFIVTGPNGSEIVVGVSQLHQIDYEGQLKRDKSNPFYRNLPAKALVLKPPAELSKALAAGLDDVVVGHYGSPRSMIKKLANQGVASLVVGGTIRDAIDGTQIKDVDIVTTTSYAANKKACSYVGFHQVTDMPWQNTVKVMGGEGLDISAMRGRTFNASMYGDTAKMHGDKAAESNDISADVVNRDFACNALYWDPDHDVLIDATGRGVQDAKSNTLHPPIDDFDAWVTANGPRNFARVFKFVGRGYKVSPELTKLMGDRFLEQMDRPDGWHQAIKALNSAGSKYKGAKKASQQKAMTTWVSKNFGHMPAVAQKMTSLIGAF